MSPHYTSVDLPYAPLGDGLVWRDSRSTFAARSLAKTTDPDSGRQRHFYDQVLRLSRHLGTRRVPVFVRWPQAGPKRMDKGCIGHALAAGFIVPPRDSADGYVTHIEIADPDADA